MLFKALAFFINFLYPPTCIICGKSSKIYICEKCNKRIKKYEEYHYLSRDEDNNYPIRHYDELIYILRYEKIIRKIMINYKFYSKPYISYFFAYKIMNNKYLCEKIKEYDYIVPVPMSENKEKSRGYNQTRLITSIISKKLKIKESNNLKKVNNALTQGKLNKLERINNIEGIFYVEDNQEFVGKRVVLLDDIYTTGSTIEECARVISESGAGEIFVIILARDFMK